MNVFDTISSYQSMIFRQQGGGYDPLSPDVNTTLEKNILLMTETFKPR